MGSGLEAWAARASLDSFSPLSAVRECTRAKHRSWRSSNSSRGSSTEVANRRGAETPEEDPGPPPPGGARLAPPDGPDMVILLVFLKSLANDNGDLD